MPNSVNNNCVKMSRFEHFSNRQYLFFVPVDEDIALSDVAEHF